MLAVYEKHAANQTCTDQLCVDLRKGYAVLVCILVSVFYPVYKNYCSLEQTHTSCVVRGSNSICGHTFPFPAPVQLSKYLTLG